MTLDQDVIANSVFDWLSYPPAHRWLASLDKVLEDVIAGELDGVIDCEDAQLGELAAYLVRRGGKRLRPALLFLAFGAGAQEVAHAVAAAEEGRLLRAAAAVELLHVATLYHDDVMDRAEIRRGAQTINMREGDASAVTAGTFIFARAMGVLAEMDGQLAGWAGQSALALALGQLQEAENAYNVDHRLESYLQIAARKTAALFELACRAGVHLAGAGPEVTEAVGLYGRALGLAFQAADDALDITASQPAMGKAPGADLREGVYALPVLLALQRDTPEADRLRAILRSDDLTETDQREAARLVTASGGVIGAASIAQEYAHQAVGHLARLADGEAKSSLVRLAGYVVLRRY